MKRIREGLIKFCGREFLVCMEHGGRVVSADAPVPTITTARGGAIGLVEPFIIEYYGTGGARSISEPLSTVTTRDRFALITPENTQVGFRMLTPGELAAAQSFPGDYQFTGTADGRGSHGGIYARAGGVGMIPTELAQSIAGSVSHD
jgi:site-specific DNA-cytosine methylase